MKIHSFVFVLFLCILAACSANVSADVHPAAEPPREPEVYASSGSSPIFYGSYVSEIMGTTGRSSLLFFKLKDDPFSDRSEVTLAKAYASGAAVIPTYRLDFATESGAKLTYGVVVPDTFVLLNKEGKRLQNFIHPSPAELTLLLLMPPLTSSGSTK